MNKFISPLDQNFTYGYDSEVFNWRNSDDSRFCCYYQRAQYIPTSFKEECVRVCHKISDVAESLGRIPTILLSGGLDSEVVVRAFIDSERSFRIVSNRFDNNLNKHEIEYIDRIATSKNLNIEYVDVDVTKWLDSEQAREFADLSCCPFSEMLPTMKLIHDVWFSMSGLPILGNGDFYAAKNDEGWNYIEFEYIVAWMRYCVRKEIISAVNFFQLTPEITLSMALDPLIQHTIKSDRHPNLRSTKYLVYKKYWRDLELRQKFNGAELIQDHCDKINESYLSKYKSYTDKWAVPLDDYIKSLIPHED